MSLAITFREVEKITVIDIAGRLWVLEPPLRQLMSEVVEKGRRYFVLNFADLNYMDSSGLGQLVSIWTSIRSKGGNVVVLSPNERILHLFAITRLDTVFEIFQDEKEALKAVQKNRQASA